MDFFNNHKVAQLELQVHDLQKKLNNATRPIHYGPMDTKLPKEEFVRLAEMSWDKVRESLETQLRDRIIEIVFHRPWPHRSAMTVYGAYSPELKMHQIEICIPEYRYNVGVI